MLTKMINCICRHIVREMPMGQFLDGFFYIASKFNPIGLTDSEIGLFTAILILCPSKYGARTVTSDLTTLTVTAL